MDVCFVDTETTGLHPSNHKIWEFAGIRYNPDTGDRRLLEFQLEVDLADADPFALNIGKYRERFGKKGEWDPVDTWVEEKVIVSYLDTNPGGKVVTSDYAGARLIERFTRGTMLWGNCVSFDAERLDRYLRDNGEIPGWHYHIQDIEPHIVGFAKGYSETVFQPPYKSEELSAWLGVEEPSEEERHTAMGDALWVERQWKALYG